MSNAQSLSHTKWECKYHLTWIPKYRKKDLYGDLRKHLGKCSGNWHEEGKVRYWKGHLMSDHVHMLVSIPPKYAVSQVVGYIKGKTAIHIARELFGKKFYWGGVLGQRISCQYSR